METKNVGKVRKRLVPALLSLVLVPVLVLALEVQLRLIVVFQHGGGDTHVVVLELLRAGGDALSIIMLVLLMRRAHLLVGASTRNV